MSNFCGTLLGDLGSENLKDVVREIKCRNVFITCIYINIAREENIFLTNHIIANCLWNNFKVLQALQFK